MNKTHDHILLSIKNSKKIINTESISNSYHQIYIKIKQKIFIDTNYPIIKEIALNQLDFQLGIDHYTFLWTDQLLSIKEIRALPYPIRVNHIPDISQITRKNKLAINLNHMKVHFNKDYDFYPETWITPVDLHKIFKKHTKGKIYIVKPQSSCQGKGIFLFDTPNKIDKNNNFVVQEYMQRPYLLNGLKFDMRIYVLITSVTPLRVYLFKEGIVRFATEKFQMANSQNLANNFSHLTNYAINKNNINFNEDENEGHKRTLTSVFSNQKQLKQLFSQVKQIVLKTIISTLPSLQSANAQCKKTDPSACFQLLGFDIILDENRKSYLLQVNQNPSLYTDTNVDEKIKSKLVRNIIKMVSGGLPNIFQEKLENKIKLKDRYEMSNVGDFERIYPCENLAQTEKYDKYVQKSQQIYNSKFGMNIVRQIKRKQPTTAPNLMSSMENYRTQKQRQTFKRSPQKQFFRERQIPKVDKESRQQQRILPETINNIPSSDKTNQINFNPYNSTSSPFNIGKNHPSNTNIHYATNNPSSQSQNHYNQNHKNMITASGFYYSKEKMQNIYKTANKRYMLQNSVGKRRIHI